MPGVPGGVVRLGARLLARPLGLRATRELVGRVGAAGTPATFAAAALRELDIECRHVTADGPSPPASGPLLAVANHPFGVLDVLLAMDWTQRLRQDWRYVALSSWTEISALREAVISVPYAARERGGATRVLREACAWLAAGHAVGLCPAGQVASWRWRAWRVEEWPWDALVGALLRRVASPVVPLYVPGRNGAAFQLAAALRPGLRNALLLRELFRQRGRRFELRIGAPFGIAALGTDGSAQALTRAVRERVLALAGPARPSRAGSPAR